LSHDACDSLLLSAKYFHNHHERAVCILRESGYLSGWIDVTRFNRRLHKLADWLAFIAITLGEMGVTGEVFVIDSLPLPVCRRVRARRCKKVRGRAYCGYAEYRHTIETVNSQCEKMGLERLYARTNPGFELKVLASIIALSCTNMI
jgi:hypothetical protein